MIKFSKFKSLISLILLILLVITIFSTVQAKSAGNVTETGNNTIEIMVFNDQEVEEITDMMALLWEWLVYIIIVSILVSCCCCVCVWFICERSKC